MPIFATIDPNKVVTRSSTNNPVLEKPVELKPEQIQPAKIHPEQVPSPSNETAATTAGHRPAIRRVAGHNALSTPSILGALRDDVPKTDHADSTAKVAQELEIKYGDKNSFSQQELLDAWKIFVGGIDSPHLRSALASREPRLNDGWQIEYDLDNELQLNQLSLELKPKLIGYLRRNFKNESIEVKFNVSDEVVIHSHVPYTDAERWALLAEKYPGLAQLKSKFGLDFEHF